MTQRRIRRPVSLYALVGAVALCACITPPQRTWACAALTTGSEPVRLEIAEESAVIVWDEKRRMQHFIRRATFDTAARSIGFLVPTPSTPELAEADDEAFFALQETIKPKVVYEDRNYYDFTPLFILPPAVGAAGVETVTSGAMAGSAAPPVTVIRRQTVSGYDAVVLTARDATELNAWLKRNGYVSSPELMEWLAPYVARNWKITAFKIANKRSHEWQVTTSAVRMSFATDRPFFPYREPKTQHARTNHSSRTLRVFFLGTKRMDGAIGGASPVQTWPRQVPWTDQISHTASVHLAKDLSLQPHQLPKKTWLTVFEDRSSPRPGVDDLYFAAASTQERIVPPPVTHYRYSQVRVPADAVLLVLVTLTGVLWLIVPPLGAMLARHRKDEEIEFRLVAPRLQASAGDEPQSQDVHSSHGPERH